MSKPQVLEEESITMTELKAVLKKIKKRDEELSYRAGKTAEYLDHFQTLTQKDAKALYDKLDKLNIPRMKKPYIDKLIDILPRDEDEVSMVLSAYPFTITKENVKKIVKVLDDFLPEKKKK